MQILLTICSTFHQTIKQSSQMLTEKMLISQVFAFNLNVNNINYCIIMTAFSGAFKYIINLIFPNSNTPTLFHYPSLKDANKIIIKFHKSQPQKHLFRKRALSQL